MSRILLADDSPHAQRMGERILRDEGYEVVTVTDGDTALIRLADADPDVVLADVFLPGKSGYEICEHVKRSPRHRHARVVLVAGLLERVEDSEVARVQADAVLKKPFEASAVLAVLRPLIQAAESERAAPPAALPPEPVAERLPERPEAPPQAETLSHSEPAPDPERVRAAVTLALHRAMPNLIEEITKRVLAAFPH